MGQIKKYTPEKLVIGVLSSCEDCREALLEKMTLLWGPVDYISESILFDFTHYYDREMGTPIYRYFVSFQTLMTPDGLWNIKKQSDLLEQDYLHESGRTVNLDPGFLALSRFVLATTKESAHRIALQNGYWAEITLTYQGGEFLPYPWTYPDFRSEWNHSVLKKIRQNYREQLKQI